MFCLVKESFYKTYCLFIFLSHACAPIRSLRAFNKDAQLIPRRTLESHRSTRTCPKVYEFETFIFPSNPLLPLHFAVVFIPRSVEIISLPQGVWNAINVSWSELLDLPQSSRVCLQNTFFFHFFFYLASLFLLFFSQTFVPAEKFGPGVTFNSLSKVCRSAYRRFVEGSRGLKVQIVFWRLIDSWLLESEWFYRNRPRAA